MRLLFNTLPRFTWLVHLLWIWVATCGGGPRFITRVEGLVPTPLRRQRNDKHVVVPSNIVHLEASSGSASEYFRGADPVFSVEVSSSSPPLESPLSHFERDEDDDDDAYASDRRRLSSFAKNHE